MSRKHGDFDSPARGNEGGEATQASGPTALNPKP